MKITREEKFTPITIVLETEEEAQVLKTLCGIITSGGRKREITDAIFHGLDVELLEYREGCTGAHMIAINFID